MYLPATTCAVTIPRAGRRTIGNMAVTASGTSSQTQKTAISAKTYPQEASCKVPSESLKIPVKYLWSFLNYRKIFVEFKKIPENYPLNFLIPEKQLFKNLKKIIKRTR